MRDNGRGIARGFNGFLIVLWIILSVRLIWYTRRWDPTTPFIAGGLLDSWLINSVMLGLFGSLASWWEITAEKNPWRLLSLRQVFEWLLVQTIYFIVSIGFYVGALIGMLFAIDATVHRYFDILERNNDTTVSNLFFGPIAVFPYVVIITFFVVVVSSTLVVGQPFARWVITKTEDRWDRQDTS